MKEFFEILYSFDINRIFREPTENTLLQFFRYVFVGGAATVVDWAVYFAVTTMGLYFMISGVLAFVSGLSVNFYLSKRFVFSGEGSAHSKIAEFMTYAVIGLMGLCLTEIIIFVFTEKLHLYFMIPKIIATMVVFVWNFMARKLALYR